jgi:Bacteriophage replication gene A protein (GPA)
MTVPSRFHALTVDRKNRPRKNKHYDGVSCPRDAQAWLCKMWARSRAELARMGLNVYGFRVAEPHHDGTPHWHALLWCRTELDAAMLEAVVRGHWLSDGGDERGAAEYRVNVKRMNGGGAAGYMSKYVAKNIGHYDVGDHIDTADGLTAAVNAGDVAGWQRVDAWASTWGIRQFQAMGQPPVCAWRELRRVSRDQIDAARIEERDFLISKMAAAVHKVAGERASWSRFMGLVGGTCLKRGDWKLQPAKRVNQVVNGYGESIEQKKIVGVVLLKSGRWLISRVQRWVRVFDVVPQSPDSRSALAEPWTRFNNCTARLTGELRAALLGLKSGAIDRGGAPCWG